MNSVERYADWPSGTPHTDSNAEVCRFRFAHNIRAVRIEGGLYRSATVNGVFELYKPLSANPIEVLPKGKRQVKVVCAWLGYKPSQTCARIDVTDSKCKVEVLKDYTGDVVDNIGYPTDPLPITVENPDLLGGFNDAMLGIYHSAAKLKPPYNAHGFLTMVSELGGKETADRLIDRAEPSDGFTELFLRGSNNLKISVEYLVLQNPWRRLFREEQLAVARQRLQDVHCPLPEDDVEVGRPNKQSISSSDEKDDTFPASDIVAPERILTTTSRIVRDTELSKWVKVRHGHLCQICGETIKLAG